MDEKEKALKAMLGAYIEVTAHLAVIDTHATYLERAVTAGDIKKAEHQIAEIKKWATGMIEECSPPDGDWSAV